MFSKNIIAIPNSVLPERDTNQIPYWGTTNVWRHCTKFSRRTTWRSGLCNPGWNVFIVFNCKCLKCLRLLNKIQISSFGLQTVRGFKVSQCRICCLSPNFEKQKILERMPSVLQNDKPVSRLKELLSEWFRLPESQITLDLLYVGHIPAPIAHRKGWFYGWHIVCVFYTKLHFPSCTGSIFIAFKSKVRYRPSV